ncbi:MAG TPA: glycosyltransferase family 4 protein [Gammaproteobacteria bacterium]|nr:glycosyltransferase family 4 protein [Gammaproteobacteria bacterium]
MELVVLCVVIFIFSALMTGVLRRYALAKSLLDVPNERSSHLLPTPRGGGVAIVLAFLLGTVVLWQMSLLDTGAVVGLAGAGLFVAIAGFIDDHGHVAARWRLLTHFVSALWLLYWLGGLPPVMIFGVAFEMGWPGQVFVVFALVWLLNLFNFMDGIDGIAGAEVISVSVVAGVIIFLQTNSMSGLALHLLIAAAAAGFLLWNMPPAKIFMGDAGSGFVGLMLGGIALYSTSIAPQMFWVWLILLGSFIVDASYTLVRRLLRGDKVYRAHRSHAYQYASRKYDSHRVVMLGVLAINLFWLAPWAVAVGVEDVDGLVGVCCAYTLLLWMAWYFHAGELESTDDANI